MKVFSLFHAGRELAIHNNLLGVETIYLDGQEMSREFSFWGETHYFTVDENDYLVEIGFSWWGVACNIWVNDEPVFIGLHERARRRMRLRQLQNLNQDLV
jgi:hypothetical protein